MTSIILTTAMCCLTRLPATIPGSTWRILIAFAAAECGLSFLTLMAWKPALPSTYVFIWIRSGNS